MRKRAVTAFFLLMFIAACRLLEAEERPAALQPSLRPPVEYKAEGLPEPFQLEEEGSVVKEEEQGIIIQLPELTIQGIVWGGSSPQAIINNKIVKAGDVIEGVRIQDIAKDGLTVSFQGREFKLPSPAIGNVKGALEKPQGGEK